MNCYVGLAKRIVKSFFPQVVPVPQLEPLDASKISKQEVKDNNTNKVCFALSDAEERVFKAKPLTDEEAWEATLAWAEAKAQEREAAALKAASKTNTDESYDSNESEVEGSIQPVFKKGISLFGDDSDVDLSSDEDASGSDDDEEFPLAAMAGLMRCGAILEEKTWNISDAAAAAAMWRDDAQAVAEESVAVAKAMEALDKQIPSPRKYKAAIIIQAAVRGMLGRYGAYTWRVSYYKVVMKIAEEATAVMKIAEERIVAWEAVTWETSDKTAAEEFVERAFQIEFVEIALRLAAKVISHAYTAKSNVVWAVAMAVSRRRTARGEARVAETVVGALAAAVWAVEAPEAEAAVTKLVASAARLRVVATAVEARVVAVAAATIIQAAARGQAVRRQIALIFVNIIDETDRMLANLWGLHPKRLCIIEMQCTHAGKYYVQAFFRWRSQKLAKTPLVGYKWDTNEKKRHNMWVADVMVGVNIKATAARVVAEKRAARIIQAAARGMSGRRNVWGRRV